MTALYRRIQEALRDDSQAKLARAADLMREHLEKEGARCDCGDEATDWGLTTHTDANAPTWCALHRHKAVLRAAYQACE